MLISILYKPSIGNDELIVNTELLKKIMNSTMIVNKRQPLIY